MVEHNSPLLSESMAPGRQRMKVEKPLALAVCGAILLIEVCLAYFYWSGDLSFAYEFTGSIYENVGNATTKGCPSSGAGNGEDCPEVPKGLLGRQAVDKSFPNITELERTLATVGRGGEWRPEGCRPLQQVAVLVPYRDRPNHLRAFLHNIHPFLQRQQLHYRIFVINQAEPEAKPADRFNRAKLMNVGFLELERRTNRYAWDCLIFHDVDLVPEHDHNFYRCDPRQPKHLYCGLDERKYILDYEKIFGGANALTPKQFVSVNGFSNHFWGYGGEDDDFRKRVVDANGYQPIRSPAPIGYYGHLKTALNPKDSTNPLINDQCMNRLLDSSTVRWTGDGLNALEGYYRVVGFEEGPLYTNISVDLLMEKSREMSDNPCKGVKIR